MYRGKYAKPRMEFSKKIMVVAVVINLLVIAFSCYMIFITHDLSALAYLIPSVSAEVATGTGFYYSKAKAENKIKLMKAYGVDPNTESFNDF